MRKEFQFALTSIVVLLLSMGIGYISSTGIGTVTVEHLVVETPYVSGCCALIDDPQEAVPFDLYLPVESTADSYPVVITLQRPGDSTESLVGLNIELARRNMAAISITIPSGMDIANMTWKGRQLGDVMAYLRDTRDTIDFEYAVITDAASANIAFSMNLLFKHPAAIVTVGYDSQWDQAARFYEGNLLMISAQENREVLDIVEERDNLTSACIGVEYGNFAFGNASGAENIDSSQLHMSDQEVIQYSTDWVMRSLLTDTYEADGFNTLGYLTSRIVVTGIISDILLGGGFLLGVISIVEYRKHQYPKQ